MREGFVRTLEAFIAVVATYMTAVTMVQTTLYNRILTKISNSFIGPLIDPYMSYVNIGVILMALMLAFNFWRKGDEVGFGRLFSLNMLMYFPSVLDYSTFNWVGLIFDLTPRPGVSANWVFGVGLLLQVTYLMLRYTVRFRYIREELEGRGADEEDINDITRGQVGYLSLLTSVTALLVAGVYIVAPYIALWAANPLTVLPVPHVVVGFFVTVLIAAAMVLYFRWGSD